MMCLFIGIVVPTEAKDYQMTMFGIKSDGVTMNTRSIQKAIDFIHENGGGRLVFTVGRYLTGSIHLKSNVTIHLGEGAVLVGSTNPYDYDMELNAWYGLILANKQENIAITKKVVELANEYGASSEAELGTLAGNEGDVSNPEMQTDPEQAHIFVNETDVDCLAVAIGTAHGFYTKPPVINISRLKEIAGKVKYCISGLYYIRQSAFSHKGYHL